MSKSAPRDISDAELALHLFIRNPLLYRGIALRGAGPVRDDMVDFVQKRFAKSVPVVRIPVNVDSERLLGGLDLSATLAAGRRVMRPGLLDSASGGAVLLPMAERMARENAAHIAQAMDNGDLSAIMLDDSCDDDAALPEGLSERVAFSCDVSEMREFAGAKRKWPQEIATSQVAPLDNAQLAALATTGFALGIESIRPLLFANATARGHAALSGRSTVVDDDILAAIRLVLSPRATRMPEQQMPPEPPPQDEMPKQGQDNTDSQIPDDAELEDILLEAAAAAIPPHILDQIEQNRSGIGKGQAGRAGQKQQSALRGRPLGARPGVPGHGRKLSLIGSLRTAAPWQTIRRRDAKGADPRKIHIRKSDLRVRHYEQRRESLTIFAVDASGSSALSRLAEAKGAVEMMLAQAYVKRAQVALVAFRQSGAEVLLPPTRSLTRARRALASLPGGGGTPLAAGLLAVQGIANLATKRGQTPTIAMLTDGKANIMMDGSANRTLAMEEALAAARSLALTGVHCIVIDISPRPREEAAQLAAALRGTYLPLPYAQSAAIAAAIMELERTNVRS